jgi:hypothetical protein
MKKHIGNMLSKLTFYLGEKVSNFSYIKSKNGGYWFDQTNTRIKFGGMLYSLSNTLMIWSSNIQDWGGKGPWENVEKQ